MYRGLRGQRLVAGAPQLPTATAASMPVQVQAPKAARLGCITWNCDGLTQEVLAQLLSWLETQPEVHIAFLQETHWGFDGDWTQGRWHFCHSAAARRRTGGVLVALRANIFSKEQIRWQAIAPGRILHIRCFVSQQHLDLICFYQHALPFGGEQQKDTMAKRLKIWKQLDALLSSQPLRSSVVLAGDFNCVFPALALNIGFGVFAGPSAAHLVGERNSCGDSEEA
eukprot:s6280_g3.t1